MDGPRSAPRVDAPPLVLAGLALAVALGLDLVAGNGLWFWYTVVGVSLLLIVVGALRHYAWSPPRAALWGVSATASLHYVGGSLSGLHRIGGVNGLYYAFPWWDNVVHFLGSAAIAIASYEFLRTSFPGAPRTIRGLLAVALASLVGMLVELYEFAQFVFFHTVDQGYYTNNLLDLYYNLLGAVAATVWYARWGVATARVARMAGEEPSTSAE